jgi:hypothetical protein
MACSPDDGELFAVVTYQFSYAGDPHLTASTATIAVTVQPGNG